MERWKIAAAAAPNKHTHTHTKTPTPPQHVKHNQIRQLKSKQCGQPDPINHTDPTRVCARTSGLFKREILKKILK